jgi:hypothetical protein
MILNELIANTPTIESNSNDHNITTTSNSIPMSHLPPSRKFCHGSCILDVDSFSRKLISNGNHVNGALKECGTLLLVHGGWGFKTLQEAELNLIDDTSIYYDDCKVSIIQLVMRL